MILTGTPPLTMVLYVGALANIGGVIFAMYIATGFDLKKEIGKISFLIFELDKKISETEIDYAFGVVELAEKKKDYLNAINYYQQALKLYNKMENILDINFKRIKLEKKISKLQNQI